MLISCILVSHWFEKLTANKCNLFCLFVCLELLVHAVSDVVISVSAVRKSFKLAFLIFSFAILFAFYLCLENMVSVWTVFHLVLKSGQVYLVLSTNSGFDDGIQFLQHNTLIFSSECIWDSEDNSMRLIRWHEVYRRLVFYWSGRWRWAGIP